MYSSSAPSPLTNTCVYLSLYLSIFPSLYLTIYTQLVTPREAYISAPSSLTNTPQKPVRGAHSRTASADSEHDPGRSLLTTLCLF